MAGVTVRPGDGWPLVRYAIAMRYPDGGGLTERPPVGRTWGRRGHTPVVTVTGSSNKRVSLAALIAIKPGQRPRLIYRVHTARKRRTDPRKGSTETEYTRLLDAAHQQLGGPIVAELGQSEHPHQRRDDRADRGPVLADRLPVAAVCARAQPGGPVWSHLKRSLANLAKATSASSRCWSMPGSGGCSTGPACSAASSPAPTSTWHRFCRPLRKDSAGIRS